LVRREEEVVGVQVDRVQVGIPFPVEVGGDRHRRVSAVPWDAALLVYLDLG